MSGQSLSRAAVLVVLATPLVFSHRASVEAAGHPKSQDILDKFATAKSLYEQGKYPEAAKALDQALNMRPDADLAIAMRDQIGFAELFKMMRKEDLRDLASGAKRLLDLAQKGIMSKKSDPGTIKAMASDLAGGPIDRWRAIYGLRAIGEEAVPHLLEYVASGKLKSFEDISKGLTVRSAVLITLRRMGRRAVLPLIQALKSKDFGIRQTAAILLGETNDSRAVPGLKALLENDKEDDRVKEFVAEALAAITKTKPESLPPAEELYRRLAVDYVRQDPDVVGYVFRPTVPLWHFDPDGKSTSEQVVYATIPAYTYTFEMAQSLCFDGLAVNPDYEELGTVILANYFAMRVRLKTLADSKGAGDEHDIVLGYDAEDADKRADRLNKLDAIGMVPGKRMLYDILRTALPGSQDAEAEKDTEKERANPAVALAVINALVRLRDDRPEAGESPLVEALTSQYVRVRFAAANALASISPSGNMLPSDESRDTVVTVMASALTELSLPAVLVVDPDPKVRERFKSLLTEIGYTPISAPDGHTCQVRAKLPIPRIALILVADNLEGFGAAPLAKALKADKATEHIPLLLLTSPRERETPPMDNYLGAVAKTIDRGALKKGLAKILSKHEPTKTAKERAKEVVKQALAALQPINPKATLYPMGRLILALEALLAPHQDQEIRIAAAKVLSGMGSRATMTTLLEVFANTDESPQMRLIVGEAIGRILLDGGDVLTPKEFDTLSKALTDKDTKIQIAAARALGRGSPIASVAMELLRKHRIK